MPIGNTTTGALVDSLPTLLMSARQVREQEGGMPQLVDKVTLGEGVGLSWNEISLAKINAQLVTETTILDNPQQLSDTLFTITPTVAGIEVLITDRTAARISKNVFAKTGSLAQNAIQRKKDEDGITVLDGGNTTSSPGAGVTLTSGHLAAAITNISSNVNEPGNPPYRIVLRGEQIKDIYDELVSGIGTYPVPEGPTARVFREGFRGMINGGQVFENGNIPISADTDAKGGVFAMEAIVLVQGRAPRAVMVRREEIGGGASVVYHYDEYAYGERSSGNWVYRMKSDATAPTS